MKSPSDCKSKQEIREAIDELDTRIIDLLGRRYQYVKEIVKFKEKTTDSIIARKRYNEVIATRRKMGEEVGLNGEIVEKIYKELINHFIEEEMKMIETTD